MHFLFLLQDRLAEIGVQTLQGTWGLGISVAKSLEAFEDAALQGSPDLGILDDSGSHPAVIGRLRNHFPGLPLALWITSLRTEWAVHAHNSGVLSMVYRSAPLADVVGIFRDAVKNSRPTYDRELGQRILGAKVVKIGARQALFLKLLARTRDTDELAKLRGISPDTARSHFTQLFEKCGVTDRANLALLVYRNFGEWPPVEWNPSILVLDRAA